MNIINIKYWSIVVLLMLIMQTAHSQKSDYIATDSSLTSGIKLIQGTARDNSQFIRLKKKNEEIKYYPNQLSEYGFKNGTVYESKRILISGRKKQVFLERLESGKINLYYYTEKGINTYFLGSDSIVFVEIKKDDEFKKVISEYTSDFAWKAKQVMLVKYNRKSLSKLMSFYNNDLNKPLSFPRFGMIVGYSSTSLNSSSTTIKQLDDVSLTPSSSLSFGVYGDLPVEMSNFSLNIGLNFSKSGFSYSSRNTQSDVDVVINYTSLNIPILIRYTIPTLVWRPFINAGGTYSYHLRNESNIYESTTNNQNIITINEVQQDPIMSESMLGYSLGFGLQRNLNYRKIAALEFRFNQLYGNENTLNKSHFEILTSFSF